VSRQARFRHPETPPEREVREALSTCGFKVVAEFQLGKFIYDFAVPKLRLLLEVDSRKFHRLPWQRRKDKLKDAWAKSQHWEVARLPVGPGLGTAALSEVFERARQLGF
jgi:very-short-patch-repair endonuclease